MQPRPIAALANAIGRFAQSDGDYTTAVPGLTLHRRKSPTEPLHCIYNLGLGVVAQGAKQVLIGGETHDYGPGHSVLTTIDLPVVSHVTQATAREPFLGIARRGGTADRITCSATITAEKGRDGTRIQSAHLDTHVSGLAGMTEAQLHEINETVEKGCTISVVLQGNAAITSTIRAE
jgi:hypothetical protein